MKKVTQKARQRDVLRSFINRSRSRSYYSRTNSKLQSTYSSGAKARKDWLYREKYNGLDFELLKNKTIIINLPSIMNFADRYEETALYIAAIRRLGKREGIGSSAYMLKQVNFDRLKSISTSAALVLTAELSKWDDNARKKLVPLIENWDPKIFLQFYQLGFFDLFSNNPLEGMNLPEEDSDLQLVKYIKGRCGDSEKARLFKQRVHEIVGQQKVDKWHFLRSGLDEAVTNVSHHAYPEGSQFQSVEKNWYLSGAFSSITRELKIVFYDQGIGIPNSLPATEIGELILNFMNKHFKVFKGKRHEVMLRAAVEMSRTSTGEIDRGKGLQDLLEFIKRRDDGYLSIISLKGLYKYTRLKGTESVKSESFKRALQGTLIIWSVTLD